MPSGFTTVVPLVGLVTTLGGVAPFGVSLASTFTTTGVSIGVVVRSSAATGNTGVVLVVVVLTVTSTVAVAQAVSIRGTIAPVGVLTWLIVTLLVVADVVPLTVSFVNTLPIV